MGLPPGGKTGASGYTSFSFVLLLSGLVALLILQSVFPILTWGSCWGGLAGEPIFANCQATPSTLDLAIYRSSYLALLVLAGLVLFAANRPGRMAFVLALAPAAWFGAEAAAGLLGDKGFATAWLMLPAVGWLVVSGLMAIRPRGGRLVGRLQSSSGAGFVFASASYGIPYAVSILFLAVATGR